MQEAIAAAFLSKLETAAQMDSFAEKRLYELSAEHRHKALPIAWKVALRGVDTLAALPELEAKDGRDDEAGIEVPCERLANLDFRRRESLFRKRSRNTEPPKQR